MDVDKTKRICERGIEYNREIKYRLQDNETSSQELDFPHRLPLGPSSKKKSPKHAMSDQDFKFAQDFKNKSMGRMNWKMTEKEIKGRTNHQDCEWPVNYIDLVVDLLPILRNKETQMQVSRDFIRRYRKDRKDRKGPFPF
ncbi:hypothetical protein CU098_007468 [Rhizopus stolonifer]|uniref:Uncharacterized protein n=1 Tax=Rhizopus stolonifer TaxID=4846 RepID=A0A367JWN6_RHIST|nr:hypothetical protein CU098_007468 [Rhizopus stolonifer]